MWRRKRNEWLPTTLGRYNGSNNGRWWVFGVLWTGLNAGGDRGVWLVGAPAEGLAIQITMYLIWQRACHRLQSHHTHRETHRALQPRQPRFTLPISTLDPAFLTTCRLLAGTDRPAQPAHAQQPHTARAPAGAARRPGAGPLSHSITAPLHFCTLAVAPGTLPARPCPQMR